MKFNNDADHGVTDAVHYGRVSSKSQTERGDGLSSQETRCRAYADYKSYNVIQVFTDDLSGQSENRPGLRALIAFLKSEQPKRYVVLIDDLSRFARNVRVHFDLREEVSAAGGILESPSMNISEDAVGELNEYIQATVNQYQARRNREQTLDRMEARCRNGYWPFATPIGYKHVSVKGIPGKILERDEPLASIIQEGLEGYASGKFDTQVEVKRFFENQPEFPKDLPNGEVRNQKITDILKRIIYAGYVEHPKWGIAPTEGKHEGLVSLEIYQKIQSRLVGNKKSPARKDISVDFPLRGFVTCGDCEKPLTSCWSTSKSGKKHAYYMCYNRDCVSKRKSIPRDKLENAFDDILTKFTPPEIVFNTAKSAFKSFWEQRSNQMDNLETTVKKEINKLERQIELLVDRIVDADSPTVIAAYEKRIAKHEKEKLIIAEKLTSSHNCRRSFDEMFEHAMQFLSNPKKLWGSERLEDKKTVLKLAFQERLPYHRETGFRTPKTTIPISTLAGISMAKCKMAHPAGVEPAASAFGGQRSIPLSYGCFLFASYLCSNLYQV